MEYSFCVYIKEKKRIDMYLSILFSDFSRSYIQALIDSWQVYINNTTISKNIKIKNRDEITIRLRIENIDIKPEKMNLDVVYEDDNILVLNKDAGINVHPVPGSWWNSGTLVNAVLYHCKEKLPCIKGTYRPWIIHRLDKDTSGLIMIAKTDQMMNYLADTIKNRKVEKYYTAIVYGIIKEKSFKIESYIWRDPNNRKKMTSKDPINPKIALTFGEVLEYINWSYTILKLKIETGRTHQIRVHLASIWFPILWDKVYGNEKINKEVQEKYGLKRQALHACILKLMLYGKPYEFNAPIKLDMSNLIDSFILQ